MSLKVYAQTYKKLVSTYSLVTKERHDRKKMTRLENGFNIGDRASNLGLNIKGMDILLSALKNTDNAPSSGKFGRQGFFHYWELFH